MPNCLIIEDNPDISRLFARVILKKGVESEQIFNGREALEYLTHHAPRLVILDMHLPEVNGAQILKFIRTEQHLMDCIVVVITADYIFAQLVESEADYVILKPIELAQLSQIVERIFYPENSN